MLSPSISPRKQKAMGVIDQANSRDEYEMKNSLKKLKSPSRLTRKNVNSLEHNHSLLASKDLFKPGTVVNKKEFYKS